jgi:hypothetical protein
MRPQWAAALTVAGPAFASEACWPATRCTYKPNGPTLTVSSASPRGPVHVGDQREHAKPAHRGHRRGRPATNPGYRHQRLRQIQSPRPTDTELAAVGSCQQRHRRQNARAYRKTRNTSAISQPPHHRSRDSRRTGSCRTSRAGRSPARGLRLDQLGRQRSAWRSS